MEAQSLRDCSINAGERNTSNVDLTGTYTKVLEVLFIDSDDIAPPPELGASSGRADFILGIGKPSDRVVFLLDVGRVLSEADAPGLSDATVAA